MNGIDGALLFYKPPPPQAGPPLLSAAPPFFALAFLRFHIEYEAKFFAGLISGFHFSPRLLRGAGYMFVG